ncbi:MAG: FKBP-type peptidyl-prolyl cis-trans isomerase [Prevotellaceae bacterium]|nr:FKBP-type peptidyl-prolyl cis-trans isomerase [Prevotellaceae bacterium]
MRKFSILLILLAAVSFSSCKSDIEDTEEYPDWQVTNADYFNLLSEQVQQSISKGDKNWKFLSSIMKAPEAPLSTTDNVIVNVLQEGTGNTSPIATDTVRVAYRGRLLPSRSYLEGYVFDQTYLGTFSSETANTYKMAVNATIVGMQTALHHMHEGDFWRIYIPSELAYGMSGTTGIPAYSMLIFDIYLDSFWHQK